MRYIREISYAISSQNTSHAEGLASVPAALSNYFLFLAEPPGDIFDIRYQPMIFQVTSCYQSFAMLYAFKEEQHYKKNTRYKGYLLENNGIVLEIEPREEFEIDKLIVK